MRWELATDQQLLSVVRHDVDCPTHLLSGVVEEMLKRNLFDNMIAKVIMKRFTALAIACRVLQTTREEIFQVLNIEIWLAVKKSKPGKSPFAFYMYMVLLSKLKDWEKGFDFGRKKILHHSVSTEQKVAENLRYEDLLSSSSNVEREVIKKITLEEKFALLTEMERVCFQLYLQGYSTSEVGKKMNIPRINASRRINSALSKMAGEKLTVKQIGVVTKGKEVS